LSRLPLVNLVKLSVYGLFEGIASKSLPKCSKSVQPQIFWETRIMNMTIDRVLIYDGDCQFCQLSLEFGLRHLKNFPKYVAFQRIAPADFGLSVNQVQSQIFMASRIPAAKLPAGGHFAAAEILRMQNNRLYWLVGLIMSKPPVSWLAGMVYRWVAKNRHRLPGGSRQCQIKDTYL
jgi:predicted DCC family thiol-disulfide oxidoreductase YuxK